MADISRRTFLQTTLTAGAAGALGGGWAAAAAPPESGSLSPDIYRSIVDDARMVWRRPPTSWQDGPFLANGYLGAQVYRAPAANVVKIMLSHSHVQDQRGHWEAAIGYSRLPIGYLTLTLAGTVTAVDWQLDLWNAELSGTITTTRGSLAFSALVHNSRSVLLVSMRTSAGEETAAWGFQPLPSHTTRTVRLPPEYVGNPPATPGEVGPVRYAEQSLIAGGGYTTAWQERRIGSRRLFAATVAYSHPTATSTEDAVRTVRETMAADPDRLVTEHRQWWNRFYTASLVSVPDKLVQRFYWIQLYKMASATRQHAPVVSEWGPWFPEVGNSWTAVWWNLNVQVAYPLVNGSNHAELDAVTQTFRDFHRNLPLSVPPAHRDGQTYALSHPGDRMLRPGGTRAVGIPGPGNGNDQAGNLIWGMHNVWRAYRHSMDLSIVRDVLYPVLRNAVNYYLHFLTTGADGKLHLPQTRSPEYANAADATYDLSLIRWGCRTMIDAANLLRLDDVLLPRWYDVLARLTPYHQDPAAGVLIGDGVPLSSSHRHFSHLLWLHPLHEYQWDRPDERALMQRTFDHWTSMQTAWHGYSYAAASTMCAIMDRPEDALKHLRFFLDRNIVDNTQLTPNTMYREGSNFAIESPLSAAQSVLDMLVQSHGRVVRVFPSVSETWRDASIAGLRTEGAFVVDASRRAGRTEWIRIRSDAGAPLTLQHGITGTLDVRDTAGQPLGWTDLGGGRITINLRAGATAVVTRRGTRPALRPRDVPALGTSPRWGLP